MTFMKQPLLAAALVLTTLSSATAQTVDEVISKHLAAIGGEENWKKVTSTKISGSLNFGGMEMPVSITTVNGKGYRMEFTMNGMANYMILTPTAGWMYMPVQGQTKAEALPADAVKEEQSQLDVAMDHLIDYKAKGCKVSLLGKDNVEGTECYKLKLVEKTGKEETMYLDASNYYHIRSVEKLTANGKEQESVTNFNNYQKLPEGILFPMSIDSDGGPMTVKTVEINKPIDESLFKPAEVKK